MKTEQDLIHIAQWDESEEEAKNAMQELRERFDSTYFWCNGCDGLVCREKDCCTNKVSDSDETLSFDEF